MRNFRLYKTLEEARAEGLVGIYSPHVSIVRNKPARNYRVVEGAETFFSDFDDDGWLVDFHEVYSVGDIAYFDGSDIKTVPYSKWSGQGTAIGVVIAPKDFLPDGKMRIVALTSVDSAGTATTDATIMWGTSGDTSLTRYTKVPTWNNDVASPSYDTSNSSGVLPSDNDFSGVTCATDPTTKYSQTSILIPSPYLSDGSYNTDYSMTIEMENNALSDFNGKENTATLVGLGTGYTAANACALYSTSGTSQGDWYLPAMGELGLLMPRLKLINQSLSGVGGNRIDNNYYWSSSEYSSYNAYLLSTNNGTIYNAYKYGLRRVRPILSI